MENAIVDHHQISHAIKNLSFLYVSKAHAFAAKYDINMRRAMENRKAHANPIFINVNLTEDVLSAPLILNAMV